MSQRPPWCHDSSPHGPHPDPSAGGWPGECPGLDAEEAAVEAMALAVEDHVREHWWPAGPPDGICVEMHPKVYYMIRRNYVPGINEFTSGQGETPFEKINIPVKVNPELPPGSWRLCRIEITMYIGGVMPGD